MPERLDRVQIALPCDTVTISWDAREQLLERLAALEFGAQVADKFRAVGTSRPVALTTEERELVGTVVVHWLNEVGVGGLPAGIFDLRNELVRESLDDSP
jgi:hypothetical protein